MGAENRDEGSQDKSPYQKGRETFEQKKAGYYEALQEAGTVEELKFAVRLNAISVDGEKLVYGEDMLGGESDTLESVLRTINAMVESQERSGEISNTLWDEGAPGKELRDAIKRIVGVIPRKEQ